MSKKDPNDLDMRKGFVRAWRAQGRALEDSPAPACVLGKQDTALSGVTDETNQ